ncbi:MAG: RNA polymerase sigma factor [Chloracidobacterium sp.]|nr:RNA polymerase sigma factor [Chloracidobacterium sp.]
MLDEVSNTGLQNKAKSSAVSFSDGEQTSDEQLVRLVIEGDEQAFAEIFERYRILVTRVVGRFFRDRSEVEEYVQQSFTKTYFSLKDFRGASGNSFPAWVTRITVNVCYDEFRRRGRRPESVFSDLENDGEAFGESIPDSSVKGHEVQLVSAQLAEKVLSSLDPKDRIAMTLVYSEEYSLSEAADVIGISVGNLKSRLFRCRNSIRDRFGHLFK